MDELKNKNKFYFYIENVTNRNYILKYKELLIRLYKEFKINVIIKVIFQKMKDLKKMLKIIKKDFIGASWIIGKKEEISN